MKRTGVFSMILSVGLLASLASPRLQTHQNGSRNYSPSSGTPGAKTSPRGAFDIRGGSYHWIASMTSNAWG